MAEYHVPVLLKEVIDGLQVQVDGWYVDATLGGGGHTAAIIKAGGRVIGLDQDQDALDYVSRKLSTEIESGHLRLIKSNFRDLVATLGDADVGKVKGILFDLGVSSHHLDNKDRGFSFQSATLDMRMDVDQPVTAAHLLESLSERDLAQLLSDWGEERYARRFAQAIVSARAQSVIVSGQQLADVISAASPAHYRYASVHPATRTFQALRLAVNDELTSLEEALPQALDVLDSGGRLAVISFHSLEDRLVKQFLSKQDDMESLTKTPIVASDEEVQVNPRARSAKLRLSQKK